MIENTVLLHQIVLLLNFCLNLLRLLRILHVHIRHVWLWRRSKSCLRLRCITWNWLWCWMELMLWNRLILIHSTIFFGNKSGNPANRHRAENNQNNEQNTGSNKYKWYPKFQLTIMLKVIWCVWRHHYWWKEKDAFNEEEHLSTD